MDDTIRRNALQNKLSSTIHGKYIQEAYRIAAFCTCAWARDAYAIIAELGVRAWRNLRVGIAGTLEDGLRSSVGKP
ncbi:hypothetical protein BGZ97_006372, partial [Linnemannia gamsii]